MRRHIDKIEGAIYVRDCVYNFHFHLIWVTKYRRTIFETPNLVTDMKNILHRIANMSDVSIEEMEVMPDHVHLLVSSTLGNMSRNTVQKYIQNQYVKKEMPNSSRR